jgi:hypothetical protein
MSDARKSTALCRYSVFNTVTIGQATGFSRNIPKLIVNVMIIGMQGMPERTMS